MRHRPPQRAWPLLLAVAGCMLVVGGTLLVLMRGAFRVGEDMLASVEDSRPLGRKLRPDEVRARAAEHVDVGEGAEPTISAESDAPAAAPLELETVTVSGRIEWPNGVPDDEHVELRVRTLGRYGAVTGSRVVTGGAFSIPVPRSKLEAELVIAARYLYLEPALPVSLAQSTAGLVLEPKLGAYVHGCVRGGPENAVTILASARMRLRTTVPREPPVEGAAATQKKHTECKLDPSLCFGFGGVIPGSRCELLSDSPWIAQPSERVLVLRPGESREVDLRYRARVAVRGRVIDAQGQPLAGAVCSLRLRRPDGAEDDSESAHPRGTSAAGKFSFQVDDDLGGTLVVTKPGYYSAQLDIPRGVELTALELVLKPSAPLAGRVLWPSGVPARGVRICADDEELTDGSSGLCFSDEDGRFELERLADGPFTLTARVWRASDGLLDDGQSDGIAGTGNGATAVSHHVRRGAELELVLAADVAARGRVVDEHGVPWTPVRVAARPLIGAAQKGDPSREVASSFDAADGSFELRGLYPGEWDVCATFAELASQPLRVTIGRGDTDIELRFERGTYVRGVVVGIGGAAVPNAQVMLWEASAPGAGMRQVRSDERGAFRFDRIAAGPIELGAIAAPDGESSVVALDASTARAIEHVELRLRATGTIRGEVVDAAGTPLDNVLVEWSSLESRASESDPSAARWRKVFSRRASSAYSGTDGTFASARLVPGEYLVHARGEPRVSRTLVVEVREGKASRIHIVLEDGIVVEARMAEDRFGTFAALDTRGHEVGLVTPVWSRGNRCTRLLLPPGSYRIVARSTGRREAWKDIELAAGVSQPVQIELAYPK